jgi:hypothetical protein
MLAVVYIPGWATAFHVVPLTWEDWAVALSVSFTGFLLVETGKWMVGRWGHTNDARVVAIDGGRRAR